MFKHGQGKCKGFHGWDFLFPALALILPEGYRTGSGPTEPHRRESALRRGKSGGYVHRTHDWVDNRFGPDRLEKFFFP